MIHRQPNHHPVPLFKDGGPWKATRLHLVVLFDEAFFFEKMYWNLIQYNRITYDLTTYFKIDCRQFLTRIKLIFSTYIQMYLNTANRKSSAIHAYT